MGVHEVASTSGSLVLALGLYEGVYTVQQVFELAELESLFQAKRWGSDPAMEHRQATIRAELESLARWFKLI